MDTTSNASFHRFAGICALAVGILGLLYALGFVVLSRISSTQDFATRLCGATILALLSARWAGDYGCDDGPLLQAARGR